MMAVQLQRINFVQTLNQRSDIGGLVVLGQLALVLVLGVRVRLTRWALGGVLCGSVLWSGLT